MASRKAPQPPQPAAEDLPQQVPTGLLGEEHRQELDKLLREMIPVVAFARVALPQAAFDCGVRVHGITVDVDPGGDFTVRLSGRDAQWYNPKILREMGAFLFCLGCADEKGEG